MILTLSITSKEIYYDSYSDKTVILTYDDLLDDKERFRKMIVTYIMKLRWIQNQNQNRRKKADLTSIPAAQKHSSDL